MDKGRKRQISLGVICSYLTILAKLISGLLYVPIIIGTLGVSEYGVYSLVTSFTGYLTIFSSGINAAYVRFYLQTKVKDKDKIPKLNGLFLKLFIFLGILSFLISLVIGQNAQTLFGTKISVAEYELLKVSFYVLACTTFITIINCVFSSMIIANEKIIFGKLIELVNTIITPMIAIPLLLAGHHSLSVLLVSLLVVVIDLIFNTIYCFKKLGAQFIFDKSDSFLLKEIAVFACFVAIQGIMDQLNWQIDKIILARTQGTREVSIYSVGSTLNTYYIVISCAMSSVFIAEINRLVALNKNKEISDLFVKTSRIFAEVVLFIMSAYCVFGKSFIELWAGVGFEDSFYVGLLIMLPVTVSLTQGLGLDIVRAKNIHKLQITINIVVCILNTLISIPLAIHYGAIGSAFGTFVAELIICIFVQGLYYQKRANLDMISYIQEMLHIAPAIIIPSCYGFVVNQLDLIRPTYLSIGCHGIIYFAIYFSSMWIIGMREGEKNMLKNIFYKANKIFRR